MLNYQKNSIFYIIPPHKIKTKKVPYNTVIFQKCRILPAIGIKIYFLRNPDEGITNKLVRPRIEQSNQKGLSWQTDIWKISFVANQQLWIGESLCYVILMNDWGFRLRHAYFVIVCHQQGSTLDSSKGSVVDTTSIFTFEAFPGISSTVKRSEFQNSMIRSEGSTW